MSLAGANVGTAAATVAARWSNGSIGCQRSALGRLGQSKRGRVESECERNARDNAHVALPAGREKLHTPVNGRRGGVYLCSPARRRETFACHALRRQHKPQHEDQFIVHCMGSCLGSSMSLPKRACRRGRCAAASTAPARAHVSLGGKRFRHGGANTNCCAYWNILTAFRAHGCGGVRCGAEYTIPGWIEPDVPVYQWRLNGKPIPGANCPDYNAVEEGYYDVVVTTDFGTQTSSRGWLKFLPGAHTTRHPPHASLCRCA